MKTIILTAGGTGGHVFPAKAIEKSLVKRGYEVVFITDQRSIKYFENSSCEYHVISSGAFSGSFFTKVRSMLQIFQGIFQARNLIKKIKPVCVIGFGGYPAFPAVFVANKRKIPTIIHEQNSLLGHANNFLADRVNKIAISFENIIGLKKHLKEKLVLVGNPVREEIKNLDKQEIDYKKLRILVIGGSQGAKIFSEVVSNAIKIIPADVRENISIIQQVIEADLELVKKQYEDLKIDHEISTFFDDIGEKLRQSNLVISRAGASTICELLISGKPSIMVPLPNAKYDHQTLNANLIEDEGAGWVIPQESFVPKLLAEKLQNFLLLPEILQKAEENTIRVCEKGNYRNADENLADLIEEEINDSNMRTAL